MFSKVVLYFEEKKTLRTSFHVNYKDLIVLKQSI